MSGVSMAAIFERTLLLWSVVSPTLLSLIASVVFGEQTVVSEPICSTTKCFHAIVNPSGSFTQSQAKTECEKRFSGHLAWIESEQEDQLIKKIVLDNLNGYWIGLEFQNLNGWQWLDGITFDKSHLGKFPTKNGSFVRIKKGSLGRLFAVHGGDIDIWSEDHAVFCQNCSTGDNCYFVINDNAHTWNGGRKRCFEKGADLATFPKGISRTLLHSMSDDKYYSIGLRYYRRVWARNSNDENYVEMRYTNWELNEPIDERQCAFLKRNSSTAVGVQWQSMGCDFFRHGFLCQTALNTSTTMVKSLTTTTTNADQEGQGESDRESNDIAESTTLHSLTSSTTMAPNSAEGAQRGNGSIASSDAPGKLSLLKYAVVAVVGIVVLAMITIITIACCLVKKKSARQRSTYYQATSQQRGTTAVYSSLNRERKTTVPDVCSVSNAASNSYSQQPVAYQTGMKPGEEYANLPQTVQPVATFEQPSQEQNLYSNSVIGSNKKAATGDIVYGSVVPSATASMNQGIEYELSKQQVVYATLDLPTSNNQ